MWSILTLSANGKGVAQALPRTFVVIRGGCYEMNHVGSFIMGLLSSLAATGVAAGIAYATRKYWLDHFQNELVRIYMGKDAFIKAIKKDIQNAQEIHMLSMRGEAVAEELDDLLKAGKCLANILIAHPDNPAIDEHRKALDESKEYYISRLHSTAKHYEDLGVSKGTNAEERKINLMYHMESIPFRLIFVDDFVCVSSYPSEGKINDVKHFKYRKNKAEGSAYIAYKHYFDTVMNNARYHELRDIFPQM